MRVFARARCWVTENRPATGVLLALWLLGSMYFITVETEKYRTPTVRASGDGRYYYAYVVSMVLDRDLDFANQYAHPKMANAWGFRKTDTGRYANPFYIGSALMWMPTFLVAHGVSLVVEKDGEAGFSDVHQMITLYASFLYVLGAGLLAYAMARRRFGQGPALLGMTVAFLCGPLLQYAVHQPSFSHGPSAFTVAAVLFVWDTGRESRGRRGWLLAGGLVGLSMAVRPSNVVFAVPLLVEGIRTVVGALRRREWNRLAAPSFGAVAVIGAFLPQMIAWNRIFGWRFGVPQGGEYMYWTEPMILDALFSSRNGLVPYAPLWGLGLVGLIAVVRRERELGLWLGTTFLLAAWVNGAAADWWAIGSVGHRRFDGLVVHVTVGLSLLAALVFHWVEVRPRAATAAGLGCVVGLFAWFNAVSIDEWTRRTRFRERDSNEMLSFYTDGIRRMWKPMFKYGNPLSLPGALAFWARTGASPKKYEAVVGPTLLDGPLVSRFQRRDPRQRADVRFGDPGHERWLDGGFGPARKEGDVQIRPLVGRGRLLLPLNNAGPVDFRLSGRAMVDGTLVMSMNGDRLGTVPLRAGQPLDAPFTAPDDIARRGVNVLELRVEGSSAAETVLLRSLHMECSVETAGRD